MPPSTSSFSSSPLLFQDLIRNVHSRKLFLHTPLFHSSPDPAAPPGHGLHGSSSEPYPSENSFDSNVVMILSVLLCALICALGLNSIVRCALRCSSRVTSESGNNSSNRLTTTGVKKKALKMFPVVTFSDGLKLPGLDSECAICLSEFSAGERVRILPNCNHGFHTKCIDKWLSAHTSCPTCRHCLIDTCQKIVGQASSSAPPPPPPPLPPPPPPTLQVVIVAQELRRSDTQLPECVS
ncbi:RING-H2 finger protein ATL78-like [Telopea speciosissima]|uniref:RING-H2 finger protein ATL78-like n=1 Tax=Telopea speciosissima TaxID=54955 RepID=UPI001CC535F1|nr:RING-H2 finger protein ATL78-like [Telopea speciosissima]